MSGRIRQSSVSLQRETNIHFLQKFFRRWFLFWPKKISFAPEAFHIKRNLLNTMGIKEKMCTMILSHTVYGSAGKEKSWRYETVKEQSAALKEKDISSGANYKTDMMLHFYPARSPLFPSCPWWLYWIQILTGSLSNIFGVANHPTDFMIPILGDKRKRKLEWLSMPLYPHIFTYMDTYF